jgi:LysR family transcriptional regulator, low CO2-responsive transcriptional regulator
VPPDDRKEPFHTWAIFHKVSLIPITLHQLTSFLTVAREGSISGAAERLYVTQPSVSAAIASLAREVGADLTERSGRGIALTPAGEAFRTYVEDVLGLLEQGTRAAREVAERSRRTLRLVAVATAAEYVVPPLLRTFAADHPEIDVSLEVANRARVFERVLSTGADIAVAGRPPGDDRVIGEPFLPNELIVIASADDKLVGPRSVAPERLGERTWLLREEGSGTRQLVMEFLDSHGLTPPLRTLGSNGSIKQAVQLGLGLSLQSRVAVEEELATGRLGRVAVRGGLPERQWYVLRSAIVQPREPVRQFLEFLREAA